MQFAVPPRGNAYPPPHGRSRLSFQRRRQFKVAAVLGFFILALLLFLSYHYASSTMLAALSAVPAGTSGVVIVTVLDRAMLSDTYIQRIKKNREDYVKRHGYTNFFADVFDYETALDNAPRSWAMVPALRHAMAVYPDSAYFYHLSPHALIMEPTKSLKLQVLDKMRLESLMLNDISVVPPNSAVKTVSHLSANEAELIFTLDAEDLSTGSFIIKQGEFAGFFLDAWFDPLYRKYNFAKAETHTLDHIVQWHPTILARLALVPQRVINSYSRDSTGAAADGIYRDGDLVVRFSRCDHNPEQSCESEMESYYHTWEKKASSDVIL